MMKIVVGIGEILWDVFPEHRRMGGAPVNFACQCRQLGVRGIPVSCIGRDALGDEIVREMAARDVESGYLQRTADAPTGTVRVVLSDRGVPSYTIEECVAWDRINLDESLCALARQVDAVCFGSLAQRAEVSRESIQAFLSLCRPDAVRIFDVNLRQRFYSRAVIEQSLQAASVCKVSDEEMPEVAEVLGLEGALEQQLRHLIGRYALDVVACTMGAQGAVLMTADSVVEQPACRTAVVDTVGAGDAFTAALCVGLLNGDSLETIGKHANAVAGFVCEQQGATPALPAELIPSPSHDATCRLDGCCPKGVT